MLEQVKVLVLALICQPKAVVAITYQMHLPEKEFNENQPDQSAITGSTVSNIVSQFKEYGLHPYRIKLQRRGSFASTLLRLKIKL